MFQTISYCITRNIKDQTLFERRKRTSPEYKSEARTLVIEVPEVYESVLTMPLVKKKMTKVGSGANCLLIYERSS